MARFKVGDRVWCNGQAGAIGALNVSPGGMCEVRLESGVVCVDPLDLISLERRAGVETQSMLVLSTGHVTEATAKVIDAQPAGSDKLPWGPQMRWSGLGYGWMWYVDDDTINCADYPPEFGPIFALAGTLGVEWVRFDCDASKIEELPFYEW